MSELVMNGNLSPYYKGDPRIGTREREIIGQLQRLRKMFEDAKKPTDIHQNTGYGREGSPISIEAVDFFLEELAKKYPYSGLEEYKRNIGETNAHRRYFYGNLNTDKIASVRYYKLYSLVPGIEQVVKAGIVRVFHSMTTGYRCPDNVFELLKRNFKKGKSLKEITGLPSYILSSEFIRNIDSISAWNEFRITAGKYANTKENFDALISMRDVQYSSWGIILRKVKSILNTGHYTLPTLLSYLDRLDIYQAIRLDDGIDLLSDYLSMCRQCEVEPRLDSNSLKREHDVMQRNFSSVRNKIDNDKFDAIAEKLKRFEYEEDEYIVIAPKSAEDLINEGIQQRNCVGSYIRSIISGHSIVMFMRSKRAPDRSLVTLELFPDDMTLRQARLACNSPVSNEKMNAFIKRWVAKVQKDDKKGKKEDAA